MDTKKTDAAISVKSNATTAVAAAETQYEYKLVVAMDSAGILELQKLKLTSQVAVIMTTIDPPGVINDRIKGGEKVFFEVGSGKPAFRKKLSTLEFNTYEFHSGTTSAEVLESFETDPALKAVIAHCLHYAVFSVAAGKP
jgi:hypothetical protein